MFTILTANFLFITFICENKNSLTISRFTYLAMYVLENRSINDELTQTHTAFSIYIVIEVFRVEMIINFIEILLGIQLSVDGVPRNRLSMYKIKQKSPQNVRGRARIFQ